MKSAVELRDLAKSFHTRASSATPAAGCFLLGVFGFGVSWLLSGVAEGSRAGLPSGGLPALICGALTAVVAAMLNLIFCATSGLCAFFLETTSPLYWGWQKLGFAFGGLMFPLDTYPDTLRGTALATPFPSLLYALILAAAWTTCVHRASAR